MSDESLMELRLSIHQQSYAFTHELIKLALRTAFILNAGAATALLSYIGSKSSMLATPVVSDYLNHALIAFAVGIFLAALTTFFAFMSQGLFATVAELEVLKLEQNQDPEKIKTKEWYAYIWRWSACGSWLFSILLFWSLAHLAIKPSRMPLTQRLHVPRYDCSLIMLVLTNTRTFYVP